jgi:hypothetical protein
MECACQVLFCVSCVGRGCWAGSQACPQSNAGDSRPCNNPAGLTAGMQSVITSSCCVTVCACMTSAQLERALSCGTEPSALCGCIPIIMTSSRRLTSVQSLFISSLYRPGLLAHTCFTLALSVNFCEMCCVASWQRACTGLHHVHIIALFPTATPLCRLCDVTTTPLCRPAAAC